jgi:GGDEF domain-containing protein
VAASGPRRWGLLGPLGGDEFGVIAAGADDLAARKLAQRLAGALSDGVSASVRAAIWERTEGASELVRRADWAMYQARRHHRRDSVGRYVDATGPGLAPSTWTVWWPGPPTLGHKCYCSTR